MYEPWDEVVEEEQNDNEAGTDEAATLALSLSMQHSDVEREKSEDPEPWMRERLVESLWEMPEADDAAELAL